MSKAQRIEPLGANIDCIDETSNALPRARRECIVDRPTRIDFRLVRGPVPHVMEAFVLAETATGTSLTWEGQLGTDFWAAGAWWGDRVATAWEGAVRTSLRTVGAEAERRATPNKDHDSRLGSAA